MIIIMKLKRNGMQAFFYFPSLNVNVIKNSNHYLDKNYDIFQILLNRLFLQLKLKREQYFNGNAPTPATLMRMPFFPSIKTY